jgi:hypothetical protein
VPGASDNAIITNNGTYTVTINFSGASNNTMTVGGSAGVQTLLLAGGALTSGRGRDDQSERRV